METSHPDVSIVPNTGWDERIIAFKYKRIVTNFAVVSERYVVLIDTLINQATAEAMVNAVQDALSGGRQLLVINTHADWDHFWGNMAFVGPTASHPAPIIGHRLCRERILAPQSQADLAQMQETDRAAFAGVRLVPPTITFDGPFSIAGGDLTFDLIHTPGHKPDHISIFIPEIRTLFPVDAAEDPLPFVLDAASLPLMRASFKQLLSLEPERVLYHHALGSIQTDVIHQNIAYFDDIERRAQAALAGADAPNEFGEADDVEGIVGYPFSEVAHIDGLDDEEHAFYLGGHRGALRATLNHLRHGSADGGQQ
jgi:glyoxylase-like metal-dependent hydrolase (beta-lactamase superfamily II)